MFNPPKKLFKTDLILKNYPVYKLYMGLVIIRDPSSHGHHFPYDRKAHLEHNFGVTLRVFDAIFVMEKGELQQNQPVPT